MQSWHLFDVLNSCGVTFITTQYDSQSTVCLLNDVLADSSQRLTREYSFIGDKPKPKEEEIGFLEKNLDEADNPGLDSVLHVGDRVCVFIPSEELKEVQRGKGGWSMRMTEVSIK